MITPENLVDALPHFASDGVGSWETCSRCTGRIVRSMITGNLCMDGWIARAVIKGET